MSKINALCAFAALVSAPAVALDDLSETGEFLDGVAAIVNEGVVLKSQFNEQMNLILERAEQQGMQLPPAGVLEEQVLSRSVVLIDDPNHRQRAFDDVRQEPLAQELKGM